MVCPGCGRIYFSIHFNPESENSQNEGTADTNSSTDSEQSKTNVEEKTDQVKDHQCVILEGIR